MKINKKFRIICLMMVLLGLNFSPESEASVRGRVLNDVQISRTGENVVIQVSFNFPVRYLRHYPLDFGQELNIQLEPILAGLEEVIALKGRESLAAPENNPAGLVRVEYEGNELLKPTLRITLDKGSKYKARQGDDFRSLVIMLPATTEDQGIKGKGEASGKTTEPQQRILSPQRQADLLKEGAEAMTGKEYMRAVLVYTELLDSADPEVRELAQFSLAEAQENKGHLAHARAEYKNYLSAYPAGKNAGQARNRLQVLADDLPAGEIAGEAAGWQHDYFGSLSVYYTRDESLFSEGDNVENLSSLLTGFDATWRSKSKKFTAEAVVVGSYELSFLDRRDNRTRFNRLYVDFTDANETFISRLGRQSSSKGGVLTRFDGAQAGYRVMDKVRVNLVAGFPVNLPYDGVDTDRYFYGINFDLGRFADHWDFNTYFINQLHDDIDDRRAVGGEVRYIGQRASLYSLLDYDILFDELSVFLFTGNYLLPNDQTRINLLADFRGVPILSTSNAMIGQVSPSLEGLEETIGEDEVRRLAEDRTLDSSFATLGISHPLTANVQIAGDVSWSKIDSSPASGGVEAFESTGDDFFYYLQLIGSGLIKAGDISSTGLRYADTRYRDTLTLTLNSRYPLYDKLRISPRLQIDYRKNKIQTGEQWRFIPGLRLEYILGRNWHFEIDGEYRFADQELEGIADGDRGYWFTFGLRWDF